jgi:hypothetical protein
MDAAGPYGSSRTGSISGLRARRHADPTWFCGSRLIDHCALPSVRPSYFDSLPQPPAYAATVGARWTSFLASNAQAVRAIDPPPLKWSAL